MAVRRYAYVGGFHFAQQDRGITAFSYDSQTGDFASLGRFVTEMNLGYQIFDRERNILFAVDESKAPEANDEGGGQVISLRVSPETGGLEAISARTAPSPLPCCLALDATGRYALVTHFSGALALLRITGDGMIGEVCDTAVRTGATGMNPLHSVVRSPDGKLFLVCDTGKDRIAAYGLDGENGKLLPKGEVALEAGSAPRYGLLHPERPWFFCNCENRAVVYAFRYDCERGALETICVTPFLESSTGGESPMVSDICLHPDGRHLYVAARTDNSVAMLIVADDGSLSFRQRIASGGVCPRGLCVSPDGRFLFAANQQSGSIDAFSVAADGMLKPAGRKANVNCPANMQIIEVDDLNFTCEHIAHPFFAMPLLALTKH